MSDASPTTCPLCHQPNRCGISDFANCWCRALPVPPALLATLPPELRGKACLCRNCIESWLAAHPPAGDEKKAAPGNPG
ncbi:MULTISPECIES: cysteine-rich CWC family protein [Derxia]|uniref:Cysteine-rich CWC family protein n=1 Tax=Derxia gummosa DSM 723 TaxID=1121388 RepID=A0A8B6XA60_9BURK|nr:MULTISPECIES: cysteine-rich CWC family protein [Derxia]